MAFQGFEADRGRCDTLKYRCPAAAFGFAYAASLPPSGVRPGDYGRILRIDLDNRRLFTPTPRGSPSARLPPSHCHGAD
ncbi:MAG: hypothetical protein OXF51_07810 [Alphaproteobacteria bacterium]|nr:hypothetical protein [Alphaproteobacteria bacterium]